MATQEVQKHNKNKIKKDNKTSITTHYEWKHSKNDNTTRMATQQEWKQKKIEYKQIMKSQQKCKHNKNKNTKRIKTQQESRDNNDKPTEWNQRIIKKYKMFRKLNIRIIFSMIQIHFKTRYEISISLNIPRLGQQSKHACGIWRTRTCCVHYHFSEGSLWQFWVFRKWVKPDLGPEEEQLVSQGQGC